MSAESSQQLKQLQTRETKLVVATEDAYLELKRAEKKYDSVSSELVSVRAQIRALKKSMRDPIVTEHALLRYLERSSGLDVDAVKKKILPPDVVGQIQALGNGKYPIGDGLRVVVKDGSVVSVVG